MIKINSKRIIEGVRLAGRVLGEIFCLIEPSIQPGISTEKLDMQISKLLREKKMVSQAKGYKGYQHVSCISINDEVVHGVPSIDKIIQEGDIVKVDICASYNGCCADMARCFFVGDCLPEAYSLVKAAHLALDRGIEKAIPGNRLSDVSAAIQQQVESCGYGVVREFCGHGIGKKMHEEPEILNYGKAGSGPIIRSGMIFALEPMITQGHYSIKILSDGWTAVTADGSLAAHVEDTVIVTEQGPEIVTRL